jgi:hypothetical protein
MRRRIVLYRLILAASVVFGLAVLVLSIAFATWPSRARHILGYNLRINLTLGYRGCLDLRFNVVGAPPTRAEGPIYVVDLPPDGRWHTSTNLKWGESVRFDYFRSTQTGFVKVDPRIVNGGSITFPDRSFAPYPVCID